MHTFFVLEKSNPPLFSLEGEDAHHLSKVLRLKIGEKVKAATTDGKLFLAEVASIGKTVTLTKLNPLEVPPPPFPIHLHLALLKAEKMEWVIQKAVELNIEAVSLVITQNSVRQELSESKWNRMQKIAEEAQKQCGRLEKLKLFSPAQLGKAISTDGTHLACLEKGERKSLKELSQAGTLVPPIHIWIGPEGGWDKNEIDWMHQNAFIPVTLGPLILRAETAAVHALSSVSTLL